MCSSGVFNDYIWGLSSDVILFEDSALISTRLKKLKVHLVSGSKKEVLYSISKLVSQIMASIIAVHALLYKFCPSPLSSNFLLLRKISYANTVLMGVRAKGWISSRGLCCERRLKKIERSARALGVLNDLIDENYTIRTKLGKAAPFVLKILRNVVRTLS